MLRYALCERASGPDGDGGFPPPEGQKADKYPILAYATAGGRQLMKFVALVIAACFRSYVVPFDNR